MSITIAPGACFHCGLPNTEGAKYPVIIAGQTHNMCCPGCQAVAQAIVDNGLQNYYDFRTEPAAKGDSALDNTLSKLAVYDEPELQDEFVYDDGNQNQIQLTVEGITCAACGWLIEKQLAKLPGVKQVSVNVSARRASVSWDASAVKLSAILSRLKSIGYESLPFQSDTHEASYKKEYKTYLKKLGLAGIMTMQVMMLAMGQYFDILGNIDEDAVAYFNAVSLLLTTPVVLYSGSVFYIGAVKAIQARTVNMDVPVTIAILATYIAGLFAVNNNGGEVYFESICMFIFFLLISRFLEHRSRHKASQISANMHKLIPATAYKLENNEWVSVLAKLVNKGDVVMVKAGESVPVDGHILEGKSTFDESMLTGEFNPVTKSNSDMVYAGSLNQQGTVIIKVSAGVKHAMMTQILRLQEMAMANKPHVAAVADALSRYFVSAVLFIALATYLYWNNQGNEDAFWYSISVLVATCPCALGLATPSALTCAMAKLNKLGVLLKRADALEQLTVTSDIVFDKTGTLTQGKFSISKQWLKPAYIENSHNGNIEEAELHVLAIAKLIESHSEHPIALAFDHGETISDLLVSDVNIDIGKGISAIVAGQQCKIGTANYATSTLSETDSKNAYGANVLLSINEEIIAAFWLSDTLHKDAKEIVNKLKGNDLTILSGDLQINVEAVANNVGISNAVGEKSPEGKLNYIKQLQQEGKRVLMLGDGINDAPVLAAADVSIAVGNASDLAKNAADIVLLNPKLNALVDLLKMAKLTKRKIKQNIAWALSYNVLVLPFAVMGLLTPWQAALGMSLSSIIVVYNSTRLLR
ncbi:heavy metal translocating P-type ATPase [Glaciecola sp. 2405UD65-10]|uniref:heavy metal translocating P-type ATPase n=1 Tax=Glaciecola sp. 2405UD65-10 TaxID=3397244 RepID=UPI003B5CEC17